MTDAISSLPARAMPPLKLDEYWPYQVMVLADRIARRTAAVVRDKAGLNLSQWRVLAALAEKPGRTAVDVVAMTPMDKGIVSRATKALLGNGLLFREASQADGRVSHLYLTEKGEDLYQTLRLEVEAVPHDADALLSPEQQAEFCELVKRLAAEFPEDGRI